VAFSLATFFLPPKRKYARRSTAESGVSGTPARQARKPAVKQTQNAKTVGIERA
jgi:hypothetical protein